MYLVDQSYLSLSSDFFTLKNCINKDCIEEAESTDPGWELKNIAGNNEKYCWFRIDARF